MTILQCMLGATIIIPIVYFYRFGQLYKKYLDSFRSMATLNYLFLMNHCSVQYDGKQFAFSARFVECRVFDDYVEPLKLLIETCVKDRLLVFHNGNEGVPVFNREKLLAKMKELIDEADELVENYSSLDVFSRYLLSRVQKEYKATYEKIVEEYTEIEKKKEVWVSCY